MTDVVVLFLTALLSYMAAAVLIQNNLGAALCAALNTALVALLLWIV